MQKNSYHSIFSDVNIIRYLKTAIIELCLMSISSDVKKTRYHRILSDVNIIRYRKTDITEICLMLISSDAEKQLSLNFV